MGLGVRVRTSPTLVYGGAAQINVDSSGSNLNLKSYDIDPSECILNYVLLPDIELCPAN